MVYNPDKVIENIPRGFFVSKPIKSAVYSLINP